MKQPAPKEIVEAYALFCRLVAERAADFMATEFRTRYYASVASAAAGVLEIRWRGAHGSEQTAKHFENLAVLAQARVPEVAIRENLAKFLDHCFEWTLQDGLRERGR